MSELLAFLFRSLFQNQNSPEYCLVALHKDQIQFFSLVRQKAFIEVNEQGTEAAAATYIGFVLKSAEFSFPIQFTCDRPFMFLIRDTSTDVILFSGHVKDPTK